MNQNKSPTAYYLEREEILSGKEPENWVQVDGQNVPTSHGFWTQIMAQSYKIDRSNTLSWISIVISVIAIVLVALFALTNG